MATKSKELLTKAAQEAADTLKSKGWKQKEYMSSGVIALTRLSAEEQLKCKEIAYHKEFGEHGELHDAIQLIFKIITGTSATIKILPDEQNKIVQLIRETFAPKKDVHTTKK